MSLFAIFYSAVPLLLTHSFPQSTLADASPCSFTSFLFLNFASEFAPVLYSTLVPKIQEKSIWWIGQNTNKTNFFENRTNKANDDEVKPQSLCILGFRVVNKSF